MRGPFFYLKMTAVFYTKFISTKKYLCDILNAMERESIKWRAPEFEHREKSADWYWILGIVTIVGALIAVIFSNILFAMFIIISGFIMGVYGSKNPDIIECEIDKRGIRINDNLYTFVSLHSFWIDETHKHHPVLLFTSKSTLSLQMSVLLPEEIADPVQDFLLSHMHEELQQESFTDRIMKWIHF